MLGLYGGAVVPGDTLVELLWGTDPPRTAAKALQTHISALRRALGDGFVLTQGTGWTLDEAEIDAVRYTTAVGLGRQAMAAGDADRAVVHFDEALTLWRGAPELPVGNRGDTVRTRWIEGHASLVEDRADALLACGQAAELIGELETAIADAPLRERRWGQLMLALYRAGRQSEALGAYRRVRSLLADELGVDPGPDLRRLESRIVVQDVGLEVPVVQHISSVTRAVTFLLTDIEGSTAAWEADAGAMGQALARHDEIVEQAVTFRGGRLIKTRGEGDATFSVFDRPSGAAAAAVELQEAIRGEPWALAEPLRIRVALHTGEVEFRDGDYFGRAVNRAARLRSVAAGGQILCSGATAELVIDSLSEDVLLVDLGTRPLKNLARPEHVFELRVHPADNQEAAAVDLPSVDRPDLPAALCGGGPFVGRGRELEQLWAAWQAVLGAGAHAVLISGEPGVGKTRLAGEWSRQAHQQTAVVLYGRCDEDLGAPYQPFAEALRTLIPCMGAARLRGLRGIEPLLSLVPNLVEVLPDLVAAPPAAPDAERYALFDAVVALLGAASAAAPIVLVLDDLHWAAKPTLLLLRHVLRFGEHARVQILGTYRSTDLDRAHPLAAMLADLHRDGSATRLALGGLDESDVTTYVAEAGYDDDELARALASVTGGNPFFLIEALRHVDESEGRWAPDSLPQGVREAVSRRLSRLPAETNQALAAAAVVGSRFAVELVERVLDRDLVDAFDEAEQAGILIEEPGGRYRFNHAIVRQSLLVELASVRRMRWHQKIATALESEPDAHGDILAELAYHYFECAWAGNAHKAVEYCRRAADQAMTRLGYEGAADLYDKALHALEELDEELPDRENQQAELLIARCEALLAAGDVASATGAVAQLRAAAQDSERTAAWGTCFEGQLTMLTDPERLDEIEVAVGAAAGVLDALDDSAGEAKAHTVRAGCLARLGRIGDCETALDQALTAARRAGDHRRVNAVLAGAPLAALWGPNPVPRAGGRCLDVVRLLRITTGSPVVEATSTRCQGVLDAFRGRAATGRRLVESARRTLSELGMRHSLLEVEQFAGIVELIADEPAAAEVRLRKAYNGFRRMRLEADTAEAAALLARACVILGRDTDADELCIESERLAGHAFKAAIAWRTVRAQLLARAGAHSEARAIAEDAVAIAERTDALVDHGDACLALATVLSAGGDAAGARAAAQRAADLYECKGATALVDKARKMIGEGAASPRAPAAQKSLSEPVVYSPQGKARLENAASRVDDLFHALFAKRCWDQVATLFADDVRVQDRRQGLRRDAHYDRAAGIAEMRVMTDLGVATITSHVIAVRGDRLALCRTSWDTGSNAFATELLRITETDAAGQCVAFVVFDADDFDAALEELDARYLVGEAAPHRSVWSVVAGTYAMFHRRHRLRPFIEQVYRLGRAGAVISARSSETTAGGEQRVVQFLTVGGDAAVCCENVDDADLGSALARCDVPDSPAGGVENSASLTCARLWACLEAGAWDAVAALFADDVSNDDRRRVVNAGIQYGRDAQLTNLRRLEALGASVSSEVVATRGRRLTLNRFRSRNSDLRFGEFAGDILIVIETNSEGLITAGVLFDSDDIDPAYEELENRYLVGEAATHASTWGAITQAYAAMSRGEMPSIAPSVVTTDHRHVAPMNPDDGIAYLHASWDVAHDFVLRIEAVHRLDDRGAVFSRSSTAVSEEGFTAQWRAVDVVTVDGELITRGEIFDETDLDAALDCFEALGVPAVPLENAASRVCDGYRGAFAARDWPGVAGLLAENLHNEDRREVVNAGIRHGAASALQDLRTAADLGITSLEVVEIANRGERLALSRGRTPYRERSGGFVVETLQIAQIDAGQRVSAIVLFDPEDMDAALAELDARFVAGEAAPYACTWKTVTQFCGALNRRSLTANTEVADSTDSRLQLVADGVFIETVHQLSDVGAVVTLVGRGTSPGGSDAPWRAISVITVEGERVGRCEAFGEQALDAAVERFTALSTPDGRLYGGAAGFSHRFRQRFANRDWDAIRESLTDDFVLDDRRRTVNAGVRLGRDAEIDDLQAAADVGFTDVTFTGMAARGRYLVLSRIGWHGATAELGDYGNEWLGVVQFDTAERIAALVMFDLDDIDAAFDELDRRYLAVEAAPHRRTWTLVTQAYRAFNERELSKTTPDWVNIDHRRAMGSASGEMSTYVAEMWSVAPDVRTRIETVHRLSGFGAVFSHTEHGTTDAGFAASWREVTLLIFEGDAIRRCELFDEVDLPAALARFDELDRPAATFENAATRMDARLTAAFNGRDLTAYLEACSSDAQFDDRRKGMQYEGPIDAQFGHALLSESAGSWSLEIQLVAVRGRDLALSAYVFRDAADVGSPVVVDTLVLAAVGPDQLLERAVIFDADDADSAFAELEARFLAGEAAPYARTWSAIVDATAAFAPGTCSHIAAVHRLVSAGAVFTRHVRATSGERLHRESPEVVLMTVEDGRLSRCEVFGEKDLGKALARFESLSRPTLDLENVATRTWARLADAFNGRDVEAMLAATRSDGRLDDRRTGVRDVHEGATRARVVQTLFEYPAGWRLEIEHLATRGSRLCLSRQQIRDVNAPGRPVTIECLTVTQVGDDGIADALVNFDPTDIDGALTELTERWIASGEVAHPATVEAACCSVSAYNRRDWDALAALEGDAVYVNYRQLVSHAPETIADHWKSIRALVALIPDLWIVPAEIVAHSAQSILTYATVAGTSVSGADIELPALILTVVDGMRVTRMEAFDSDQYQLAMARFDELQR